MVKDELQISRDELKTARGELWVVKAGQQVDKEELQVVKDELPLKTTTLSRVFQEVSKAESTVGHLNNECRGLQPPEAAGLGGSEGRGDRQAEG